MTSISSFPPPASDWWHPAPGLTWQWQLDEELDTSVKAQVYAGGRGKAGGIKLAADAAEAEKSAAGIIGARLITHQTSAKGATVGKVLVEKVMEVRR